MAGITQIVKRTPRVIIVGASQGIGKELAKQFSSKGYIVGLMARDQYSLDSLWRDLEGPSFVEMIDLEKPAEARLLFHDLIFAMGGVDVVVISAGIGLRDCNVLGEAQYRVIRINIEGFLAISNAALDYFESQGHGQLVGFSSVSALHGDRELSTHSASKAFVQNYLNSKRQKYTFDIPKKERQIFITDICPCVVDDKEVEGVSPLWILSNNEVASRAIKVIEKKKDFSYLVFRWRLLAWFAKWVPDSIYYRFFPQRKYDNKKY